MDLLKLLQLDDLPEQQTRTRHLAEENPDFQFHLGFDACCRCGKSGPTIECDGCHRVKYCSKACRSMDGNISTVDSSANDEEEDPALGHSAVICSILQLVNDDEAVEENLDSSKKTLDKEKRSAAIERLSSEFESFPATLANIVMDGPCYQDVLDQKRGSSLTIHVVGASKDAELWQGHPDSSQENKVFHCYGEALVELAENRSFSAIKLVFIGLELPEKDKDVSIPMSTGKKKKAPCDLLVQTHCGQYTSELLKDGKYSSPDIVVCFNPGFTCPDYDWEEAVRCIPEGTPILVTTNTELEGIADAQYLLDLDLINDIPPGLEEALGIGESTSTEHDSEAFFSVNPCSGTRVRQSGTMANDLYVKSRWILGTIRGKRLQPAEHRPAKKPKIKGSGNTKKTNPALV